MRKSRISPILGCLLLAFAGQATAASGPWKVEVWQAGVPGTQVQAGAEFQVRGEGFHATVLPVKVCVFDQQCQLVTPDRAGNFMLTRAISQPGSYEIRVFQARDMNISEWRLRATRQLTVSN